MNEEQLREKYESFIEELGDERLDQLAEYGVQLIVEAVQDVEFLTVLEVDEAEGWGLAEDEQEFLHDFITSSYTAKEIREALL